ncbi:CLUMA_CG004781, isoform A [Clunio marinus]|uniref:CLUMA_CG004781, isoform A n=1 Tax=Clunio marinus TaxID=568069 RepID=A0A1J1HSW5_9DIPT|nr:CLUMA_CG004781, isoform A [Clunio marinus]
MTNFHKEILQTRSYVYDIKFWCDKKKIDLNFNSPNNLHVKGKCHNIIALVETIAMKQFG